MEIWTRFPTDVLARRTPLEMKADKTGGAYHLQITAQAFINMVEDGCVELRGWMPFGNEDISMTHFVIEVEEVGCEKDIW
jgi:hypothetical protein